MFRYIGLIELSKLQLVEILYFYLPELIMVCASTIIQRMLIKINVEEDASDSFIKIDRRYIDPSEEMCDLPFIIFKVLGTIRMIKRNA